MARTRREEDRLLTTEEREIVAQTHHPVLGGLDDSDLAALIKRLRDRRDRAQGIARQQRREMRGKSAPAGARAASDDTGSQEKGAVLSAALKRVNKERTRRQNAGASSELSRNARRALRQAKAAESDKPPRPDSRTADEGMQPIVNEGIAPSGNFDAEGGRPVLERSRKVR